MEHLELLNNEINNDTWMDNLPSDLGDDAVEFTETKAE
jgi:hypothetical protein